MTPEEKEKYYGVFEFHIGDISMNGKITKMGGVDNNVREVCKFIKRCLIEDLNMVIEEYGDNEVR